MKKVKTQKSLERYLWEGLNLDRFKVIQIIPQNSRHAVIIMYDTLETSHRWCLEYLGNGHYFETFDQLLNYYNQRRFRKPDVFEISVGG